MKRQFVVFLVISLFLSACSKKEANVLEAVSPGVASEAELSQRQAGEFLSYSHSVTVDLGEKQIQAAYSSTVDACVADKENGCTILDAKISSGNSASAYIKLRTKPDGVRPIVGVAAGKGKIVQEFTHVEDLAQPVVDIKKRLEILETYRASLLRLQEKASSDIQALIKVSEELAKVQAQIENAEGRESHLKERIAKDIVEINFTSVAGRSFWRPILEALSEFKGNLSEGISDTVSAVAYLLPWVVLGIPSLLFLRYIWRRGRGAKGRAR